MWHSFYLNVVVLHFVFSSVQFSRSVMSDSLQPHERQHARPPCLSPTPGVYPNSRPLSWWCHSTISSSVIPFSCPQSFPASGSFPMSGLFASGGQAIGTSASASVLPMNIQDWFPLWLIGLISLQAKGLSRVQYHNEIYEIDSNKDLTSFLFFLDSKSTTDGDCRHEIKRCFLLGRKIMTNLDSILKSRDITLPTKVRLVKTVVFPVVMYGCESWTIKKAEHRRIDAFDLWCWRSLWESRRLQGDPTSQS